MTLADFLRDAGERPAEFARRIGTSRQNVTRWANGETIPRKGEMDRIAEATNGKVQAADFYGAGQSSAA